MAGVSVRASRFFSKTFRSGRRSRQAAGVIALACLTAACSAIIPPANDSFCVEFPDALCNPFPTAILYTPRSATPRLQYLYVGRTTPDMYRMNPTGGDQQLLTSAITAQFYHARDSRTGRLYLTTFAGNTILALNADGSGLTTHLSASGSTAGIDIHEASDRIYFAVTNDLYRANIDGSNQALIASFGATLGGVKVDQENHKVYVAVTGASGIYTVDLDGGNMTQIITPATGAPTSLALDHPAMGRIFWSNNSSGLVSSANVDGSDQRDLAAIAGVQRIAYDPYSEALFFVAGTELYRMHPNGSPSSIATASFYADIALAYE